MSAPVSSGMSGLHYVFPRDKKPYECQRQVLETTASAIAARKWGFVSSPTGTGKTLALLIGSLAQAEKEERSGRGRPKVIYASRTHAQLKQVCATLRSTVYGKRVRCVVLGSRAQLCTHDQVSRLAPALQQTACERTCKARQCHLRTHELEKRAPSHEYGVADLEDLKLESSASVQSKKGKKATCAYYLSKFRASFSSDIIFMPYNYLLDDRYWPDHFADKVLKRAIVIIDEAHNVAQAAEDAASFQLTLDDLEQCEREVRAHEETMSRHYSSSSIHLQPSPDHAEDAAGTPGILKEAVISLRTMVETKCTAKKEKERWNRLFDDFLKPSGLGTQAQRKQALREIDALVQNASDARGYYKLDTVLKRALKLADRSGPGFWLQMDEGTVSYRCLSAAPIFKELDCLSIVLASGTLPTIDDFFLSKEEREIQSPLIVETKHAADAERRVFCRVLGQYNGQPLSATYANRTSVAYKRDLAQLLATIIKSTNRGGVIIFFSSFAAMDDFVRYAKSDPQQLWHKKLRSPIIEQKKMVKHTLTRFDRALQKAQESQVSGAVPLFAVCRGQLAEGIDLADDRCRTVVVVGLPLSPLQDPVVQLKRSVKGDAWYYADAMTAVNQALGRCVRHANDFGALFLLDTRFTNHLSKVSTWLRDQVQVAESLDDLTRTLPAFFAANYRHYTPLPVFAQRKEHVATTSTTKGTKEAPPRRAAKPTHVSRPIQSKEIIPKPRPFATKRPLDQSNSLLQADFRGVSWPSMLRGPSKPKNNTSMEAVSRSTAASMPLKKKKRVLELAFSDSDDDDDNDDDDSIDIAPPKPDAAALGGSLRAQRILGNLRKK